MKTTLRLTIAALVLTAFNLNAATLYVSLQSTNPVVPYATWANAATNIQHAVDAAAPGDTVLVTNGLYATGGHPVGTNLLSNRVAIEKPIRLESVNGPAVTIIEGARAPAGDERGNGAGAVRCVYLGLTNAVLSGFTLTNGHTRTNGDWERDQAGGGAWGAGTWDKPGAVLTNCVLVGNSAFNGGGAYYATLYNCTLTGNSAGSGGGASGGTLNNCTLSGNLADDGGGAADATLYNCTLTGNSAVYEGGGAFRGTLYNCTLTGNSARLGGGASEGTLINCMLTANSAGVGGGGASGGTLNNCTLSGNLAGHYGGGADNGTLNNCTLTGNSAVWSGGGAEGGTLNNCIVYFNRAASGANYFYSTLNYCCTTPLPAGSTGNIALNPQLASTTHLSAASPCIGAGNPAYATGVDIDGEPWANLPSMGSDELVPVNATGLLSMSIAVSYTNVAQAFPVAFTAHSTGPITQSIWDFGDGTRLTNQAFASHAWTTPGTYTVQLTGYNDTYPGGVSTTMLVEVVAVAVYYVNVANPTPAHPYASWGTAATNIQDAIGAGTLPGRLVLVTNGVYRTGTVETNGFNRVVLIGAVAVRSVNGPELTVIEGEQRDDPETGGTLTLNVRCAYVGDYSELSGFTLTNGSASEGGGAYCEILGTVTNSVITGNTGLWEGGGGVFGGNIYGCSLADNTATEGGGAMCSSLFNCTVARNIAVGRCLGPGFGSATGGLGGGVSRSTAYNCTLIDNDALPFTGLGSYNAPPRGGGAFETILNNCTLTGNSASMGGGASGGTLHNCIVYFNTAGSHANYVQDQWGGFLNYCCTTPLPTNGVGNITNAPLFVTLANGDLHLQTNSPCINAGNNAYVTTPADLDDLPRIVHGTVDIGAYEFQSPDSLISYAWLQQYGLPTDGLADAEDPDTDGHTTWQEWRCRTNPTNALSALRLLSAAASPTNTNVTVTWQSVAGVDYFLERSTNLGASPPFILLANGIPGQPGTTSHTDTNAASLTPLFYRVGVSP